MGAKILRGRGSIRVVFGHGHKCNRIVAGAVEKTLHCGLAEVIDGDGGQQQRGEGVDPPSEIHLWQTLERDPAWFGCDDHGYCCS